MEEVVDKDAQLQYVTPSTVTADLPQLTVNIGGNVFVHLCFCWMKC